MFIQGIIFFLSLILTLLFFVYGFNHYYLLNAAFHYSPPILKNPFDCRPAVSVHLPIYNEKYVVRRLIAASTRMAEAYGIDKVNILILDDSDDDTVAEIDAVVTEYIKEHFHIEVLHRGSRQGFKAGALQAALERTSEDFIAIFDADFIPPPDFLLRTIPYLVQDEHLGIVQTSWGHLNRNFSFLTKCVSILMDVHFIIEQPGRYAAGLFQNFNGSGGVLRKEAILEAGGWRADTLAEDLDLSYRMQILGYQVLYLRDLKTPGEIPPTLPNHKQQQSRWACGSLRVARKILPLVLPERRISLKRRLQTLIHLTGYLISPLMTFSFLLACISTFLNLNNYAASQPYPLIMQHGITSLKLPARILFFQDILWLVLIPLIFLCTIAPWVSAVTALRVQKISILRNLSGLLALFVIGFGTSLNNTLGAARALLTDRIWEWTRTPKYADLKSHFGWRTKKYQITRDYEWLLELAFACLGTSATFYAIFHSNFSVILILIPFSVAYAFVSIMTVLQR